MGTRTQRAGAQHPRCVPRALRYRHRYLRDDTFDNVYITRRFVELDLRRAEQGRPTVLPLTAWESGRYIPPGQPRARRHPPGKPHGGDPGGSQRDTASRRSRARPAGLWLSRQEQRRYGLQLVGVLRHMLLGFSIILADFSLFWLLDLVRHQLRGEIVSRGEQHPLCWSSTLGCFAGWGPGLWGDGYPVPRD